VPLADHRRIQLCPIEIALGEAMTALATEMPCNDHCGKSIRVPAKDFRIIGTLNSFDRITSGIGEALNAASALLRSSLLASLRDEEQAMVLYKALRDVAHLDPTTIQVGENEVSWRNVFIVTGRAKVVYQEYWDETVWTFQAIPSNTLHGILWRFLK